MSRLAKVPDIAFFPEMEAVWLFEVFDQVWVPRPDEASESVEPERVYTPTAEESHTVTLQPRGCDTTELRGVAPKGKLVSLLPDWEAARRFAPVAQTEPPDPEQAAFYRRAAVFYRSLYPALAGRFAALQELTKESLCPDRPSPS